MTVLVGCSNKTIVKKKPYHNFTIYEHPPELRLKITSYQKVLKKVDHLLSNPTKGNITEARKLVNKLLQDHSKNDAIKALVTKIKVQKKIIENYERDIRSYQEWLKEK